MRNLFLGLSSLSARIRLGFILVPLLLCIFLCIYSVNSLVNNKNDLNRSIAQGVAQNYIEKIDRNFYERHGDVQAFSVNQLSAATILNPAENSTAMQTYMNTLVELYPYDLMTLCDSSGKVIAVNNQNQQRQPINTSHFHKLNYGSADWFRNVVTTQKPWYSDFIISEDIIKIDPSKYNGYGMIFANPVTDSSGRIIGVWANFVNWNEVVTIRKELETELTRTDPAAIMILTDSMGCIIDATDPKLVSRADSLFNSHLDGTATLQINKAETDLSQFMQGSAESFGHVSYKGRHWRTFAFIPKIEFSFGMLFSKEMMGLYGVMIIMILLALFIASTLSKQISSRITKLKDAIEKLSHGEIVTVNIHGKDELNQMGESINELSEDLKTKVIFSEQIGQGNLQSNYTLRNEQDELGKALLGMRNSLITFNEQEERRKWATEGMAIFGEILRQNDSFEKLCDNILSRLVKYVNANQAGIFVLRENEHKESTLDLIACFAYNRKKYLDRSIRPGQGLVGQCYLEKNYIYLNDIPQDYLIITSGLGEATPGNLLLVPLVVNDVVYGVMEIASFNPFEEYQIDFLQKLSESVASSINLARSNETTRRLYEESRQMTEELRAQEEEMRQNMEELMATQEEIERKEQEYLARIEELERELFERK